jgi:hypothetical protein
MQRRERSRAVALVAPGYERCVAALAACRTTDEVRDIRDRATAMRAYARQAKDRSLEADAFEIRARAERRLGELLLAQKSTVGFNTGAAAGGKKGGPRGSFLEPRDKRPTLAAAGIDKKLSMRAQRLAILSAAEFRNLIFEGRERIIAVGREHAPLDNLQGGVEWYTPSAWVERARSAMGSIDEDPASCKFAQRVVKASTWFDKKRDGLAQAWRGGGIFLNPPYARGVIDQFVDKLIAERASYAQAIALVDNRSDTAWFHRLCGIATAVAFPKGRVGFYSDDPLLRAPSVWGSAFIYVGERRDAFADAFADCLVFVIGRAVGV